MWARSTEGRAVHHCSFDILKWWWVVHILWRKAGFDWEEKWGIRGLESMSITQALRFKLFKLNSLERHWIQPSHHLLILGLNLLYTRDVRGNRKIVVNMVPIFSVCSRLWRAVVCDQVMYVKTFRRGDSWLAKNVVREVVSELDVLRACFVDTRQRWAQGERPQKLFVRFL